jgi:hypothetical protein
LGCKGRGSASRDTAREASSDRRACCQPGGGGGPWHSGRFSPITTMVPQSRVCFEVTEQPTFVGPQPLVVPDGPRESIPLFPGPRKPPPASAAKASTCEEEPHRSAASGHGVALKPPTESGWRTRDPAWWEDVDVGGSPSPGPSVEWDEALALLLEEDPLVEIEVCPPKATPRSPSGLVSR